MKVVSMKTKKTTHSISIGEGVWGGEAPLPHGDLEKKALTGLIPSAGGRGGAEPPHPSEALALTSLTYKIDSTRDCTSAERKGKRPTQSGTAPQRSAPKEG